MHCKYLVRDADSDNAAVFLGSANYTDNSWGLQESNLLHIRSRPLASIFTENFARLFATGRIPYNPTNRDVDSVNVSGVPVNIGFRAETKPGDRQGDCRRDLLRAQAALRGVRRGVIGTDFSGAVRSD